MCLILGFSLRHPPPGNEADDTIIIIIIRRNRSKVFTNVSHVIIILFVSNLLGVVFLAYPNIMNVLGLSFFFHSTK